MSQYLKLIAKKLSGEIRQEEARALQEWLDESPQHELEFHRIKDAWHKAKFEPYIQGQEKTFEKIALQLGLEQQASESSNQISGLWKHWRRIAAIIVLLIVASMLFVWYEKPDNNIQTTANTETVMISKSNPRGQKSMIRLPDGTKVTLNAESYLEYPQSFKQLRQVKLVGEAFFEVVRDSLRPFTVTSGEIEVKVLGTSFNVQAFPFEEDMTVAVASGAVMVKRRSNGKPEQQSQLQASEMLKVNHKSGAFSKSKYDTDELLAWKEGILVFHQASFEDIIHKLERWYGVDFVIRRNQPVIDGFTGRYQNPSLKVILEGMSYSSNFTYRIEGDTVIIE